MKTYVSTVAVLLSASAFATTAPVVSDVTMTQQPNRRVTITYKLTEAPAIVTVDVQTNRGDGTFVSIGGKALRNLSGSVGEVIQPGDETRQILWDPRKDWREQVNDIPGDNVRAVVTAWATNMPPDYLVINLADLTDGLRYYPGEDFLPLGIESDFYRTNSLVMRKIPASGIRWRMGAAPGETNYREGEDCRWVTLSEDFYMAVFETTDGQAKFFGGGWRPYSTWSPDVRPAVCDYRDCRGDSVDVTVVGDSSFIGRMRKRYGLAFDLPTEAQWEFACRAGCKADHYDGTSGTDYATLNPLCRYRYNSGRNGNDAYSHHQELAATESFSQYSARVGSYKPNAWGLYDMLGNLAEVCIDFAVQRDSTATGTLVDPCETDAVASGGRHIVKGGSWSDDWWSLRAAFRYYKGPTDSTACDLWSQGFRVVLPIPGR